MVTLTDNAKNYMRRILSDPGQYITLGVKGGGCSGFQYVWGLSKEKTHGRVQWSEPIEDILLLDERFFFEFITKIIFILILGIIKKIFIKK